MSFKVDEIMSRKVFYCNLTDNCLNASKKMVSENISSLVVLDGGKAVGLVTEHDFLVEIVSKNIVAENALISDIYSNPLTTLPSGSSVEDAARLMRDKKIKKAVVVDVGRVMGIISAFDIIEAEPVIAENSRIK